jgi:hypothetical protein
MNRFVWVATQWIKNLGLLGMAGVLLLVLSIAGYWSITFWENSRLDTLTQEVTTEKHRLEMSRLNPGGEVTSPGAQLQAFYEFFPTQQAAPNLFRTIYSAAHEESINLAQGEYKFIPAKSGRIGSYQVNLPVRGSYIQIRKFIVKVMNSVPSAALQEVSFRREAVSRADLEAKIRFSIYMSVIR